MQSKDLSASATTSADELQEGAAGTHANADDSNLSGDRHPVASLNGHCDTRHVGRQSA
jgi:hypothetical protein